MTELIKGISYKGCRKCHKIEIVGAERFLFAYDLIYWEGRGRNRNDTILKSSSRRVVLKVAIRHRHGVTSRIFNSFQALFEFLAY